MKRIFILLLLCGCSTTPKIPLPPLPPNLSWSDSKPKPVVKIAKLKTKSPHVYSFTTTSTGPHYFAYIWDISTNTFYYTNFISQWDQLIAGWYYTWETAPKIEGPWTYAYSGRWTSTATNAYFGLELPEAQLNQFQRAFGNPPSLVPDEIMFAQPPLWVNYKGKKYIRGPK